MSNQIIKICPSDSNIIGLFREDDVIIPAETSVSFSTVMPEGFLSKCHRVSFHNIGENELTINFQSMSPLYFYNGYVSNISIGSGSNVELFNEPVTGKWRGITDPSVRLIWEDSRLKGQVYQDGEWHTCLKGGY